MKYLEEYLNMNIQYGKQCTDFPNYIKGRYRIQKVQLNGIDVLFVYPLYELETIETVKKHLSTIQKKYQYFPVICLKQLTSRQKQYLLREHIPFIVEDRQIYLPFMATYLSERNDPEKTERKEILPSAQLVLLYFIEQNAKPVTTSILVKQLGLTSTSIQRAVTQLKEYGLIHIQKQGVQKILSSDRSAKELFEEAQPYLLNPVKRTVYVNSDQIKGLLSSGYSALSHYSMLNPSALHYFATNHIDESIMKFSHYLQSTEQQVAVELWRYDPKKLSGTNVVDPLSLSLALSFRNNEDERVEEAVEEMLKAYWRKSDGKRY